MNKLLLLLTLFVSINLSAQLDNGSIAPDFTAVDIEGNEHNLYDLLAEGKSVVLDFSATWCGPCWSYHIGGALEEYYEAYGPDGTDEAMVFYIESDVSTTMADLNGLTAASMGDWVTGTEYPIIDDASVSNRYLVGAYPTIMLVCPDRTVTNLGQIGADPIHTQSSVCPGNEVAPEPSFSATEYVGCGALDVTFRDNTWPRADEYLWNFGDGSTSTEAEPSHSYSEPGNYSVTLDVKNEYGETTMTQDDYINIGEGDLLPSEYGGPTGIDIGTGRYFEGGHQGLIFDAHTDIVISSVKVFSSKAATRIVSLLDADGNVVNLKEVDIPEGEVRITLDLFVPAGSAYRLGLYSDAYLFRNDGGAAFPYEVGDFVTITNGTAGTEPLRYYYYYYDWEVREAGCSESVSTDDLNELNVALYPSPAYDVLHITAEGIQDHSVDVFTNTGERLNLAIEKSVDRAIVNVAGLNPGLYVAKVGDTMHKFYKQ